MTCSPEATRWLSAPAAVVRCGVIDLQPLEEVKVCVICLDKPDSDHNIINEEFGFDLARAVHYAKEKAVRGDIDVVVVCSAKNGSFLVGADIETELKFVGACGSQKAYSDCSQLQYIFCALEALPVPTVAVINGIALGGGLELALACDYRVGTPDCNQIGLPEVKLGVLPGAGGCCRLPRLIGFRQSLGLILTGKSISTRDALKQGIIDALFDETGTICISPSEWTDYKWLSQLLKCIKHQKIGKKSFLLTPKLSHPYEHDLEVVSLSEDQLRSKLLEESDEYECKAASKYPRQGGRFYQMGCFIVNVFFYLLALFQVWRTVGFRMPAPYMCLQTVFRCFYAGSWIEAMSLNAIGFATLVKTAESKNLMSLYLLTRKLKKCALNFGDAVCPPSQTQSCIDKGGAVIYCVVTSKCMKFASSFVQGLLHSGYEVHVVDFHEDMNHMKFNELVRKHFNYSIRRGHVTLNIVKQKMEKLHVYGNVDFKHCSESLECFLVDLCFWPQVSVNILKEVLCKRYSKVVQMILVPALCDLKSSNAVVVNVGNPVRKNTICVEITPASSQTSLHDLRRVAAFVSSLGKIPVVVPVAPLHSVAQYFALSCWARAVSLVAESGGGFTPKMIDNILCSAGYSKGPFATMDELDPFYRCQLAQLCDKISFKNDVTALRGYLVTGKIKSNTTNVPAKLSKADVSNLFHIDLALTALKIQKEYPSIPTAAIDVLCVSGLAHFPPEEGGPFSYMNRNGLKVVHAQCSRLVHVLKLRDSFVIDELINVENASSPQNEAHVASYTSKQVSEMSLLSNNDMIQIGPVKGVQNQEVLLYPLPLGLVIVCIMFQCVFVLFWLIL